MAEKFGVIGGAAEITARYAAGAAKIVDEVGEGGVAAARNIGERTALRDGRELAGALFQQVETDADAVIALDFGDGVLQGVVVRDAALRQVGGDSETGDSGDGVIRECLG